MHRVKRYLLRWLGTATKNGPFNPTPNPPTARSSDSEEDYRRLFERVPDGIYQTTPDGRLLAANPALLQMLGYDSVDELRRLDLARDLHVDPRARTQWIERLEREDQVRDMEFELRRKDGRRIVVLDSASVVRGSSGEVLCYEGTLTEITNRKRAEELQAVLINIFRAANSASDLRDLLKNTQQELARLIDTSNFYVAIYEPRTGLYSFPFHVDKYEPNSLPPQPLPKSLTDYVRRTARPLLVDDEVQGQLTRQGEVELVGVSSPIWLGVPLKADDEVFGVLAVQSYEERALYSDRDLELLSFVAENIGQAVLRKRSESVLRNSEQRFRALFEASPDAIFVEDHDGKVLDANPAAVELQGIQRDRLVGLNVAQLVPPEYVEEVRTGHQRLLSGDIEQFEGFIYSSGGLRIPVEVRASPFSYDGSPAVLLHVRDITKRKEHEKRLEYLARFDALTGLPNRFLLEDRLRQALVAARRAGDRLALHYLDLDEFKQVNDTLGHTIGDELLKAAGQRLAALVRETDTVARLGGDEFAVIQSGIPNPTSASVLALRVLEAMVKPFRVAGHTLHITTSVGISLSTSDEDAEQLLLQADRALYKAKELGRGTFRFHDDTLADEVQTYVTLRHELDGAVERGEFFLEYQPQIELATGRVVGAEALVRWRHPTRGLLLPGRFIPVTENTGLIIPIGSWVLREACRQRRAWCDAGLIQVPTAVNLSAVQFRDLHFMDTVQDVLRTTRVRPQLLELELTETLLMQSSAAVHDALRAASRRGISIAVDDFGTGYSSLQYLRQFPVSKLKIAMEFVQGVTRDSDDDAIVAAVISLGHQLGLKVIAEGVETEEQLEFLRGHGCDEAQGYYFSRPLSPRRFAERLVKN